MHELGSRRMRSVICEFRWTVGAGLLVWSLGACNAATPTHNGVNQQGGGGVGAGGVGAGSSAGTSAVQAGTSGGVAGGAGIAVAGAGAAGTAMPGVDGGATVGPKPIFTPGTDPNRNAVMPGKICDRISEIQCAGEEHCCDNPGRTRAQCKTEMLSGCMNTLQLDAVAMDPITGFDAPYAKMTFDTYEMKASTCDPTVADWGSSITGLRGILKGTRANDASCTPATTNPSDKAKIGAALASCTGLDTNSCEPSVIANVPAGKWTCTAKHPAGGICVVDTNCSEGLFCDNPKMVIGKCAARKAPNTPCVNPNECASFFCKGGKCVESGVQPAYCLKN